VPQRLTASNRSVSLMTRSFSFTNINSVDSVMSSKGACDRESFVRHRIRFRLLSCQVKSKLQFYCTRSTFDQNVYL
jgi:predicted urease superfamily metal-dependent hydrolase